MSAKVADVMTRSVIAVRKNASFKELAVKLRDERISAFPVIDDDDRVIGVVSEADLIAKEAAAGGYEDFTGPLAGLLHRHELEKARALTAGELMSKPPVIVRPDDTVSYAAQLMYDHRIKRLPVVDGAGRLAGIVSRTDVLSVFSRPDEEIRHQITHDVMLSRFLTDPLPYRITVKDGVVTLAGEPETDSLGHEIVRTVRHIEGVVAVRDRLDYRSDEPARTFRPLV
jgi:CBS domain-containing protein